jgi:hypothetical protein
MTDLPTVESLDELKAEAVAREATVTRLLRERPQVRAALAPFRPKGEPEPVPGPLPDGHRRPPLLARCLPETGARVAGLVRLEGDRNGNDDHTPLVVIGCIALERELVRLVVEPAREVAGALIERVAEGLRPGQVEILRHWQSGLVPATLGTVEMVLFALRRGLTQPVPEVVRFVAGRFHDPYDVLLRANGFGRAAGALRNDFRNKAFHGLKPSFTAEEYGLFCRLVVGNSTFGAWAAAGPQPDPPEPDHGLLHHHLALSRPGP